MIDDADQSQITTGLDGDESEDLFAGEQFAGTDLQAQIDDFCRMRAYFVSAVDPVRVAVCDWHLGDLHTRLGEFDSADRYFDDARRGFAAEGLHHHQADIQWNRVRRYLGEATQAEAGDQALRADLIRQALDVAISSYIATEYERFQGVAEHEEWEELADQRLASTFDIAYRLGTAELLAELIDCGINTGIHRINRDTPTVAGARVSESSDPESSGPKSSDPTSSAPEVRLPALTDPVSRLEVTVERPASYDPTAITLGAAARLLDSSRLDVDPPPALLYPAGGGSKRLALQAQRELAGDLDPDLQEILRSVPKIDAW